MICAFVVFLYVADGDRRHVECMWKPMIISLLYLPDFRLLLLVTDALFSDPGMGNVESGCSTIAVW
jgi:hypothetical protein